MSLICREVFPPYFLLHLIAVVTNFLQNVNECQNTLNLLWTHFMSNISTCTCTVLRLDKEEENQFKICQDTWCIKTTTGLSFRRWWDGFIYYFSSGDRISFHRFLSDASGSTTYARKLWPYADLRLLSMFTLDQFDSIGLKSVFCLVFKHFLGPFFSMRNGILEEMSSFFFSSENDWLFMDASDKNLCGLMAIFLPVLLCTPAVNVRAIYLV